MVFVTILKFLKVMQDHEKNLTTEPIDEILLFLLEVATG